MLPHLVHGELQPARDESLPGLLLVVGTRVMRHPRALFNDFHDPGDPRQELQGPTARRRRGRVSSDTCGTSGSQRMWRKKTHANHSITLTPPTPSTPARLSLSLSLHNAQASCACESTIGPALRVGSDNSGRRGKGIGGKGRRRKTQANDRPLSRPPLPTGPASPCNAQGSCASAHITGPALHHRSEHTTREWAAGGGLGGLTFM